MVRTLTNVKDSNNSSVDYTYDMLGNFVSSHQEDTVYGKSFNNMKGVWEDFVVSDAKGKIENVQIVVRYI